MSYHTTINGTRWTFQDLKTLLAKASPARSGDALAGIAAQSAIERVAAQMALADLPLKTFLNVDLVPYEEDEVSRLILDSHDLTAFAPVSHLTVGAFREWLLDTRTTTSHLTALAPGLIPEMAAAVSKIMRAQDLIVVAAKCSVITAFRNTIGLAGRLSTRLQPNHPTDDSRGIAASLLDGLLFGVGDAVIGVNVKGVFLGLRHVLPVMLQQKRGAIVNTASVAGLVATPGMPAYVASKHAVIGLTKTAAGEVARQGIRVNAVCPGPVDTRMIHSLEAQLNPSDPASISRRYQSAIPMGRYVNPEEIANTVLFLCSDLASAITGAQYVIDGGRTATGGAVTQAMQN